jgi:hypothetical protein
MWNGRGYPLSTIYVDAAEMVFENPDWDVWQDDGSVEKIVGPREFRHALSAIINTLVQNSFIILGLWEDSDSAKPDPEAEPGTWEHMIAVAPPFMRLWAAYRPDVF